MNLEDIEVAIEDLDGLVELARKSYTIAGFLGVVHSANLIRKTLEKQIAKEPKLEKVPILNCSFDPPEPPEYEFVCPICSEPVEGECYCENCGQKLDWGNIEDIEERDEISEQFFMNWRPND